MGASASVAGCFRGVASPSASCWHSPIAGRLRWIAFAGSACLRGVAFAGPSAECLRRQAPSGPPGVRHRMPRGLRAGCRPARLVTFRPARRCLPPVDAAPGIVGGRRYAGFRGADGRVRSEVSFSAAVVRRSGSPRPRSVPGAASGAHPSPVHSQRPWLSPPSGDRRRSGGRTSAWIFCRSDRLRVHPVAVCHGYGEIAFKSVLRIFSRTRQQPERLSGFSGAALAFYRLPVGEEIAALEMVQRRSRSVV